jgi:hypothetical protein
MKFVLSAAASLVIALAWMPGTAPAETKTAAAVPAVAPAPARSLFIVDPSTSRDPFYPKSERFKAVIPKTNDTAVVYVPTFPDDIRCQGFSGTPERRLAIVNNKTVEKGEKFDLLLRTGKVQVRCLEIKEKTVVLEVNGITKELGLRPTLH